MEVRGVEPLSKIPLAVAHTCVSFEFKVSLLKTPVKVGAQQKLALEFQALRQGKRKTLSRITSAGHFPAGEGHVAALQLGSECVIVIIGTYVFWAFYEASPPRHATSASGILSKPKHPRA